MTDIVQVLDHGFVRLVDHMGDDLSVVRAARVSYDAAWRTGNDKGSDARLIRYLWKNRHTSPFEAVTFTFEVKAPIFVFRQWHRHRTWSFNELSARYRELPEEYYVPEARHIGVQSKSNKQGRDTKTPTDELVPSIISNNNAAAFETYKMLLRKDVPRELARTVLPLGTYSHMFATVDLLNLFKFVELRNHAHAQYEIQVYAKALMQLIKNIVPECVKAFDDLPEDRI